MKGFTKKSPQRSDLFFYLLLLAVAGCCFHFFFGAFLDDWRLALSRDLDGYYTVKVLALMLEEKNFISPRAYFIAYGTLYYHASAVVLGVRNVFGSGIDLLDLVVSMRWVSFVSGIAALSLLPWIKRQFSLPNYVPFVVLAICMTLHSFFRYLFFPKPETLLLFFVFLTVGFLARVRAHAAWRDLLGAGVFCALGAAAKVPGVLWLPFLIVALGVHLAEKGKGWKTAFLIRGGFLLGVFLIVYLATNLRWMTDFEYSLSFFQKAQTHSWRENEPTIWVSGWSKEFLSLGYLLVFSYVAGLIIAIKRTLFPFQIQSIDARFIVSFFPLFIFFYYSLHLHKGFTQRYLLLAILPLCLGAFYFWQWCWEKSRSGAVLGLVLCAVLTDPSRLKSGFETALEFGRYRQSNEYKMGEYLMANFPRDTRIAHYFYTWVPARFIHSQSFEGGQLELLDLLGPDLVLVSLGNDRNEKFITESDAGRSPYRRRVVIDTLALYERNKTFKSTP